jgi:hypothetical protein
VIEEDPSMLSSLRLLVLKAAGRDAVLKNICNSLRFKVASKDLKNLELL